MKTLIVPKFNYVDNQGYKFNKYVEVKVKNKMNSKDYIKVTQVLPGLTVGYCAELYDIAEKKNPIEITRFYDIRQRSVKQLKGYFITLKN
tara:strand:- start:6 stop:275 length:270 start_codon:yes stop_codon:yes gene_type:complete